MKLTIEISDNMPDEVVIRCKSITDEIKRLQNAFTLVMGNSVNLTLENNGCEFYVPISDILFFETDGGDKVSAHTAKNMYYSSRKLYELEKMLPGNFMRVSKSCILDSGKVSSIGKNIAGSGEVLFYNTNKKAYVSRMYIKTLKEVIYETRIKK